MSTLNLSRLDLISKMDLNKIKWENRASSNCYAFALGFDIAEKDICESAYCPGVIGGSKINLPSMYSFSLDDLISCIETDLDYLGIDFRENATLDDLKDGEWLIALYVSYLFSHRKDRLSDYHFLRLFDDGTWYHKNGFYGRVINLDTKRKVITDPLTCELRNREFIKTYALKLK